MTQPVNWTKALMSETDWKVLRACIAKVFGEDELIRQLSDDEWQRLVEIAAHLDLGGR
jgi:hypothetical protein